MTEPTTTPAAAGQPTHPRWLLPLIGGLILCLVAASNIGNAVWASWVEARPLGLIALNSSNKYLLATSISTDPAPFVTIALLRLLAADPLFYAIGYLYGPRALHWARTVFPGSEPLLAQAQTDDGAVRKVLHVLIVVAPNNLVCLLAGATRFPIPRFIALNVIGTLGRILLMRWLGLLFEDQIEDLLDVVARYQRWFLIGSVALVVAYVAWQAVGRRGLIGGVEELEEELGDD
jgi:membrane protein DedA with SNARE-associated domain